MNNKPQNKPENGEKRMTKYDRKLEARKQQAEKDRKNRMLSRTAVIAVSVCIIGVALFSAISSALNKKAALNDAYVMIGNHEITQAEYTYQYNYTVNRYLNYYSSLIPYMGLDTSVDFAKQQYSDTMTWKDAFDQMAVEEIRSTKALLDDAQANGFVYDTEEDYEAFRTARAEEADEAGVSIKNYYKTAYGTYATEQNIKQYISEAYTAAAYEEELLRQNKPTDDEVTEYYEENKDSYDMVDYRSFTFTALLEDDATEDEIKAAMTDLWEKAAAMKVEREAGKEFETLCIQYASEDEKANYEEDENEYSLTEGSTKSSISSYYNSWLYEEGRKAGDITIIEDEDNHQYYLVEFVQRVYDENCVSTISDKLANERVSEYVENLTANYEIKDIKGDLYYLTIESEENE